MPSSQAVRAALTCTKCGVALRATARFCAECGTPVRVAGAPVGFGPRYAAFLVDLSAIIGIWFLASFVVRPFIRVIGPPEPEVSVSNVTEVLSAVIAIVLVPVVAFLYHFFYGRRGETPGMKVVGVKVAGPDGAKPGTLRSLIRSLAFWGPMLMMMAGQAVGGMGGPRVVATTLGAIGAALIAIIWISALVLPLTRARRALHDRISGTEVVRS